jgi:hypothetical protein
MGPRSPHCIRFVRSLGAHCCAYARCVLCAVLIEWDAPCSYVRHTPIEPLLHLTSEPTLERNQHGRCERAVTAGTAHHRCGIHVAHREQLCKEGAESEGKGEEAGVWQTTGWLVGGERDAGGRKVESCARANRIVCV